MNSKQYFRLRVSRPAHSPAESMRRCPVTAVTLESGEILKRGCGRRGLVAFDAGWKCFYCGNVLYREAATVESMWFHFRLGREYWRAHSTAGREFINGIAVNGQAEGLPSECMRDLNEPNPPDWFYKFVEDDETPFDEILNQQDLTKGG